MLSSNLPQVAHVLVEVLVIASTSKVFKALQFG